LSAVLVYMTAGSVDEAKAIGASLIKRRLAACVNILPGMISQYHWKEAVATEEETVLIAKTESDLADALTSHVRDVHSYECPCVITLSITDGNPDFLKWVADETVKAAS